MVCQVPSPLGVFCIPNSSTRKQRSEGLRSRSQSSSVTVPGLTFWFSDSKFGGLPIIQPHLSLSRARAECAQTQSYSRWGDQLPGALAGCTCIAQATAGAHSSPGTMETELRAVLGPLQPWDRSLTALFAASAVVCCKVRAPVRATRRGERTAFSPSLSHSTNIY